MGKRQSRTQWVEAKNKAAEQERIDREEAVYWSVVHDAEICDLLRNARTQSDHRKVGKKIKERWAGEIAASASAVVGNVLSWAGRRDIRPTLEGSSPIGDVIDARKQICTNYRSAKRRLIKLSHLNPNTFDKNIFYSSVAKYSCTRLPASRPYPPSGVYVAETKEISTRNHEFVNERTLPDRRKHRKFIHDLQDGNNGGFQFDLDPGESGVFRDASTGELVAVVIRKACGDKRVVDFLDRTISEVINTRTNIRVSTILMPLFNYKSPAIQQKEDRGHMSQMGLSAGSLSHGMLDWVKNIYRRKKSLDEHHKVDYDASSAFAVLWGLSRTLLPDEIIHDFAQFIQTLGPDLRMDGNRSMGADITGRGTYHIDIGTKDLEYHNAELSPPAGVMSENYCRYTHSESSPHKFAISFTASRSCDPTLDSVDAGGHFYIASYSIRVQAAADTLIAWRPTDLHGTTLLHTDPWNPPKEYYQRSMAIVTSPRIPGAVKKWRDRIYSREQMEKEAAVADYHDNPDDELEEITKVLKAQIIRKSQRLETKERVSYKEML